MLSSPASSALLSSKLGLFWPTRSVCQHWVCVGQKQPLSEAPHLRFRPGVEPDSSRPNLIILMAVPSKHPLQGRWPESFSGQRVLECSLAAAAIPQQHGKSSSRTFPPPASEIAAAQTMWERWGGRWGGGHSHVIAQSWVDRLDSVQPP